MAVSDRRFAAQIVAPGEEPAFFDDLGCLREHLADRAVAIPRGAIVFVADHRTSEWIDGREAVFTRRTNVATPMASGLMAHRDAASRDQDADARGGVPVAAGDVLGSRGPAGGR